jgi:hypothetical protein
MYATLASIDVVHFVSSYAGDIKQHPVVCFGLWQSRHTIVSSNFVLCIKIWNSKVLNFQQKLIDSLNSKIQLYMSSHAIIRIIFGSSLHLFTHSGLEAFMLNFHSFKSILIIHG